VSEENVEIVRRTIEAWDRRDMEAAFALYDPEIVWDNSALPAPSVGTYEGHAGVRRFFREWMDAFETQHFHPQTFIDAGDRIVVGYRLSGRGKASGAEVGMSRWSVHTVRNGLVTRIEIFETKGEALEAAGVQE
jgi:ketosteroid isomerase-like protein